MRDNYIDRGCCIFLMQMLKTVSISFINCELVRTLYSVGYIQICSGNNNTSLLCGKVKHKLRVTRYKFKSTSYQFKSTSQEFKSTSYEFKSTSYDFKSISYECKSTSYEFKSTSYEFKSTSYAFKFTRYQSKSTSSRFIKSMKTQVNSNFYSSNFYYKSKNNKRRYQFRVSKEF